MKSGTATLAPTPRVLPGRLSFIWLALAGLGAISVREVSAHDHYTAYVQHRVHLDVGARHMDLTLDLTFFEEWSARERRTMDADTNGHITRAEVERYLQKWGPEWVKQVKLLVSGREVPLVPLYEPEVDLLGSAKAGPGHHRLQLSWFTPTQPGLQAGDVFVIEDRLWPEAKALGCVPVEGSDACRLDPGEQADPGFPPARAGEARVFKVRCVRPPAAPAEAKRLARPAS